MDDSAVPKSGIDATKIINLDLRRPKVCYVVNITHSWDGSLDIRVDGVASDRRSRESIASAMRDAADAIEKGE